MATVRPLRQVVGGVAAGGSAVIAATNNAPTQIAASLVVSNNSTLSVASAANYTILADMVNSILAALKAHGIINTA